jgi:hypothetical protein
MDFQVTSGEPLVEERFSRVHKLPGGKSLGYAEYGDGSSSWDCFNSFTAQRSASRSICFNAGATLPKACGPTSPSFLCISLCEQTAGKADQPSA